MNIEGGIVKMAMKTRQKLFIGLGVAGVIILLFMLALSGGNFQMSPFTLGMAVLFGMVSGFFPDRKMVWMLWGIHIFSAVLTAMTIPAEKTDWQEQKKFDNTETQSFLQAAAKAMCLVCCWVILFRILILFLKKWLLKFQDKGMYGVRSI